MNNNQRLIKFRVWNRNSKKFIYHGTSKGACLGIQREGFIRPHNTGEKFSSVSFTEKVEYAQYYANAKGGTDKSIILRTPLTDKFILSDRIQNNKGYEYITFEPVSIKDLEVQTKYGWKPLLEWDVIFNEPIL